MKKLAKRDELKSAVRQLLGQVEILTGTDDEEMFLGTSDLQIVMKNLKYCSAKVKRLLKL